MSINPAADYFDIVKAGNRTPADPLVTITKSFATWNGYAGRFEGAAVFADGKKYHFIVVSYDDGETHHAFLSKTPGGKQLYMKRRETTVSNHIRRHGVHGIEFA